MTDVPHLALPLRVRGGRFATVEQDSEAEVLQCVEVVLRTRPGDRIDAPDLGVPDQSHRQGGASLREVADAVERYEPRAVATARSLGLTDEGLAQRVAVEAGVRGGP